MTFRLDRVEQHLVDELDHRGVVTLGVDAAGRVVEVVFAAGGLEVLEAFIVVAGGHAVAGGQRQVDGAAQAVLVDQDGFDGDVGGELDLVERAGIGGIGNRDVHAVAALEQRQRHVLLDQFLADQLDRRQARVEADRVEQRHAELGGVGRGDVGAGDEPMLEQVGLRLLLGLGGLVERLARVGLRQHPVHHQPAGDSGDPDQIRGCSIHRVSPAAP